MSRFRAWFSAHQRGAWWVFLLLVFVTLAFGVGYLMGSESNHIPIIIETGGGE